jgi:VanZ family protein
VIPARWLRLRRLAFWSYVPLLFTATHWPKLRVPLPGNRPDLLIHFLCFGLWAALLIGTAYFGPLLSWRNVGSAFLMSGTYAAFDEGLQAFPFVQRTCALDDWSANMVGIAIACGAAAVAILICRRAVPYDSA